MAISISAQDVTVDETLGQQPNDIALATFQATDYAYLLEVPGYGSGNDAKFPQVAHNPTFLKVTVDQGSTVTDLVFTHPDGMGVQVEFSITVGVPTTLKDVTGNPIYLFLDDHPDSNGNVLIGRIGTDPKAAAAFAIVLDEAANDLSAGAYLVLYEAMAHLDPNNPNDIIDLENQVFVSAETTASVPFSDFSDVPSGNTDFALIAPDAGYPQGTNILVTGDAPQGNVNSPTVNSTVNVSTQGLGSGSQAVGKNAILQIDFVTGGTANTTGSAAQISYGAHVENVTEAQFSLTQVNPNNELINLTVAAGNEQNNVQGVAFRNAVGTNVTITQVQVFDAQGVLIEDSDGTPNATGANAVTAAIDGNGDAVVTNLRVDYTVKVFSTGMDQIRIRNTDNNNNASFDVGEIQFSTTVLDKATAEVGSKVIFADDGPSVTLAASAPSLTVNEADFATDVSKNYSVAFTSNLGADEGTNSFTLQLGGTVTSLVDTLSGETVVLVKLGNDVVGRIQTDGLEVFRVSVDGNGLVTLNQSRAVVHPNPGTDTLTIGAGLISLVNTATDGDKDTASASIDLGALLSITDDVPAATADGLTPKLETDESLLASGSQQGPAGATTASASFVGTFVSDSGNDGAGTVGGYTLGVSAPNADSGLIDTITNTAVVLNLVSEQVVGTAGSGGPTVFTISVNTAGAVTFTQARAVVHADASDPNDLATMAANLITLSATVTDGDNDPAKATVNIGDSFLIRDDGPTITAADSSGTYEAGAQGVWDHVPGSDGFKSLSVTLDSYQIGANGGGTGPTALTRTDAFAFEGSITDDFNRDGTAETVKFTLTFNPLADTYDFQVTTPPEGEVRRDSSDGTLRAGGPDPVRTLLFGTPRTEADADDVVFFGVVANAPTSGVSGSNNDLQDLIVSGIVDRTEDQIQALFPIPALINSATQMNVSTAGIGINNNNLDGAGIGLQSGDESFVFNPEETASSIKVFIDNSVGGYTTATEDLFYTVYYTDGSVGTPTEVNILTPEAGGQVSFTIDNDKDIDAVQFTMQRGTIKIPVIQWTVETEFDPDPLDLNFTATVRDGDNDPRSDQFSVNLGSADLLF